MNNYVYRCIISNSWGCADTTNTASLTLGVNDINAGNIVSIYPNPAHAQLNIAATDRITSVTISNLMGQMVYNQEHNSKLVVVNIADLPNGIYFIRVNGRDTRKFVKD